MIRVDSVTDFRPLDTLVSFARRYPQYVNRITQSVFAEPPTLLSQLKVKPPPRRGKWGGWSPDAKKNMRAQRKWFAMIKSGEVRTDGAHYQRSDKLISGYTTDVLLKGTETLIEVRNKESRAYRYTKGRRQIVGHKMTGWQQDDPIIRNYVVGFRTRLVRELNTGVRALTGIR